MIVELVGLPGVGKTSLAETVCNHRQRVRVARTPYFRNPADVPFYILHTIKLLPLILRVSVSKDGGRLSRRDAALMVILDGWRRMLRRQARRGSSIVLLDEGPICYLTRLRAWGSAATKSRLFKAWWDETLQQWASTLDMIIQMDTTDGILLQRVLSREMWQEVKAMTESEALEYLADLRKAQNDVVMQIMGWPHSLNWYCFDTRLHTPEQIYQQISGLFEP